MKTNSIFFLLLLSLVGFQCTPKKEAVSNDTVKQELTQFMDAYANWLRTRDFEKIAAAYYDSGVVLSGHGASDFTPYDSILPMYQKQSTEPLMFTWEDIRIDPLSNDLALITARFNWNNSKGNSYTGVYIRTNSGWKIKHEHESGPCMN